MKTKLMRLFSALLVFVMVFAMLVACGDEPDNNRDPIDGDGDGDVVTETNWWDSVDFNDTTLTIMISNASDVELTPGGDKYMKGPLEQVDEEEGTGFEKVQNEVYLRNAQAIEDLGIQLSYDYCNKVWGSVAGHVKELEGSTGYPDMYCDLLYDYVGASISSNPQCFANLYKYTTKNVAKLEDSAYVGGALEISKGNGFYVDLMEDMALSEDKMYLLAGDYYLDVLRAMLVLPFNLQMYVDRLAQNDPDGEALYELVSDGEWTWSKLMEFQTVFPQGETESATSNNLLMALACGGLTSTGLLYSTAFELYDMDYVNDQVDYTLKTSCPDINNLFKMAYDLVNTRGVLCDESTKGDQDGVVAAKNIFTNERALFCGPMMLGVVEENGFQQMQRLSILPLPKLSVAHEYNTVINSRARVGAISYHSTLKVESAAFIQYVNENSGTVRDEYFNKAMTGKFMVGSGAGQMLTLIYNSIGDNKGMILENLIRFKHWELGTAHCWTTLIQEDFYQAHANDVTTLFGNSVSAKQGVVDEIVAAWYQCD